MATVEIGLKILLNPMMSGLPNDWSLFTVDRVTNIFAYRIGLDYLLSSAKPIGGMETQSVFDFAVSRGWIRLTDTIGADTGFAVSSVEKLEIHIESLIRMLADIDAVRRAGTKEHAGLIKDMLEPVKKRVEYAQNCCHWIVNDWDKTKK